MSSRGLGVCWSLTLSLCRACVPNHNRRRGLPGLAGGIDNDAEFEQWKLVRTVTHVVCGRPTVSVTVRWEDI